MRLQTNKHPRQAISSVQGNNPSNTRSIPHHYHAVRQINQSTTNAYLTRHGWVALNSSGRVERKLDDATTQNWRHKIQDDWYYVEATSTNRVPSMMSDTPANCLHRSTEGSGL
ncbi:hypothetical protein FRC02_001302 [Tulasnella sp. 418]|nr:hypothetical protein FRC02_001302 [Tulasnella sp. 418]